MPTEEKIAEIIMEEVLKITAELGEEAGLIFLSGVRFGADLAMSLSTQTNREVLDTFYSTVTNKGEIN